MHSRFTLLATAVVAALLPLSVAGGASAASTDLFLSEVIEGSSNNKAIEIYNGTGAPVDLGSGGYKIQMYFNGSTSVGLTVSLSGTVAAGDVFVLAQASANSTILAQADQTSGAGWFNGDDAIVLVKGNGNTLLDVFGQVGVDPGSEWGTGLTSTQDNTLRRKTSICAGDPDGSNVFEPATEWDGFAQDTFDGLGAHTSDCGGGSEPVINEFSASTTGTDVEYVEIYGEPETDYSAYTVLEVEGDFNPNTNPLGTVDEVISLGTTGTNRLYLADLAANSLENGTLSLLLVKGFTGAPGDDLDTDNDGALDATPWAEIVDAVAVNDGGAGDATYGVPALGVSYDGMPFAPGGASRIPDGTDTDSTADWVRNDFDLAGIPGFTGTPVAGEALNTPGDPNVAFEPPPVVDSCDSAITPIYDIQGSGDASSLTGESVLTQGVVVGDFQTNGRKVYLQDANGDGNAATSDGIYVFEDTDAAIGTTIRVRGTVTEFRGLTQIANVASIFSCGDTTTEIAPAPLALPITTPDAFEPYEGMLITFPQALTIGEYFNYDRFGEIVLTDGRQATPTAIVEPGVPAVALAAAQALGRITLDDGRSAQNPDPALHPNGDEFTLDNRFRGGDRLTNVTGVMDYQFGLFRIQPTRGADYTASNPRDLDAPDVGGTLRVSSFNVLNYFTTLNSRGANTTEELVRQEDKIVAAMAEIDADVIGLMEIENNTAAIQRLVDTLNALVGAGTYDYVDTGVIGSDAIKVAFLYKPSTVSLVGDHAILDESVDPRFDTRKNRPALAQAFRQDATDEVVTVAVNHLKSKGSACDDVGDPDLGDGAGNCNVTRTRAAQALVDWLADDPTGSGTDKSLIIGDLNSYDHEDPIDAIVAAGYTDLVKEFGGERAYSYVFDGKVGYLDHALASDSLADEVTGAGPWHINADEPDLIDYDVSFKQPAQDALYAPDPFRSSDHDPVIVGLALDSVAPELAVSLSPHVLWPANHRYVTVRATVTATDNSGAAPTVELVSVTSNEPDNGPADGNTVDDVVIVDDTTFKLRAERAGSGTGRVYTVTYRATDAAGNVATETATVTVPISRRP